MRGSVIQRSRVNQPEGYVAREHYSINPIPHYGVKHNYLYYPLSWTDVKTGKEYKKGYYDENGQYYETVVFRRTDGVYKNVVCQCEYCDTISKIDWTEGGPLICPQCGGTMKILSNLDEYTQDPMYPKVKAKEDYVDYADDEGGYDDGGSYSEITPRIFVPIAVIFLIILGFIAFAASESGSSRNNDGGYDPAHPAEDGWVYYGNGTWVQYKKWENGHWQQNDGSGSEGNSSYGDPSYNPDRFGTEIWLRDLGHQTYAISDEANYDRVLVWDEGESSYYDQDSELWAWFNTEVDPPLWQYWYEPISQDYGDYGWMEYEDGLWYIEADEGEWIQVPEEYDTEPLWHIDMTEYSDASPEDLDEDPAEDLHIVPIHGDDSSENLSNPEMFNEIIYLERSGDGSYVITGNPEHDLEPVWQDAEQSYYEAESGMWLWYNTEVDPPLWQYWYEPISGDFENFGWMEYEDGQWYIEIDYGDWIQLPEEYDATPLWHIE